MEILSGKKQKALKIIIYGVEGVGKTLFASKFPDVVFIDIEGSTGPYDFIRTFKKPVSFEELIAEVEQIAIEKPCKTLAIDSLDWAQNLCFDDVCKTNRWKSIASPGYGAGYREGFESFQKLLVALEKVVDAGINVVCTAHTIIETFEAPDEAASYSRYELKLLNTKKCSIAGSAKEWADIVLFANFKDLVMTDSRTNRTYAKGGQKRVMYSTRTAVWDAKNRHGLPDEADLDFNVIAHLFADQSVQQPIQSVQQPVQQQSKPLDITDHMQEPPMIHEVPVQQSQPDLSQYDGLPKNLIQLLVDNCITADELKAAIAAQGITSIDTPFRNYPDVFVEGSLIAEFFSQWLPLLKATTF